MQRRNFSKAVKYLRALLFLFILSVLSISLYTAPYAESAGSDFVDLSFKLGQRYYFSNSVKKNLDIAPYSIKGCTVVPFRVIFEELGYTVVWNSAEKSALATRGTETIKVKLGSRTAKVNGTDKEMPVAFTESAGRTVIPLRFIAENAHAAVLWDEATKSIYITRVGIFDTGNVLFFEKKTDGKNNIYLYTGNEMKVYPHENKEVVNWFSYKGKVLITIFDKQNNNNNLVIFRDNAFVPLIEGFDIKDTFEYNDNLIIHGYDRYQKRNQLYRFDGNELKLIQDDFYMGKYLIFNGKLVINKYDSARNYTLLAFDKASWTPGVLESGFVTKQMIEEDGLLYFIGARQEGTDQPIGVYDGEGIRSTNFDIVHDNFPVDINKIAPYKGKIYAIVKNKLVSISEHTVRDVNFSTSSRYFGDNDTYRAISKFRDRLYIGVNYNSREQEPACLVEYSGYSTNRILIDEFQVSEFREENNKLLVLGKLLTETNRYDDPALYIYDGSGRPTEALDVLKIKQTLSAGGRVFVDVQDRDRITGKTRDTVLAYEDDRINNLVIGMQTQKWSDVGSSLVIAGYESDIKRNKLYSYGYRFNELEDYYQIKYWNKINDRLFVNGYDPDTKNFSLYRFVSDSPVNLGREIEVLSMIKAKGSYYLVYGCDRDEKSSVYNKKVLYIYNDVTGKFFEMKTGIEVSNMVSIQ